MGLHVWLLLRRLKLLWSRKLQLVRLQIHQNAIESCCVFRAQTYMKFLRFHKSEKKPQEDSSMYIRALSTPLIHVQYFPANELIFHSSRIDSFLRKKKKIFHYHPVFRLGQLHQLFSHFQYLLYHK